LIANNRGDKLADHKKALSRTEEDAPKLVSLLSVIEHVKPTALFGLSTVGGTFTKEVLNTMAALNEKPIVFALSNPVAQAECTFEEAVEGTDGRVLYASGSAFDPVMYKGKMMEPGQGNNMFVYPSNQFFLFQLILDVRTGMYSLELECLPFSLKSKPCAVFLFSFASSRFQAQPCS
jgi:malate dehydrogenase (oxaloacetate-decarboxylating)(NADP+)